jgi:hypothetical protein
LKSDRGVAVGVQHIAYGGFHVTRHTTHLPTAPPGARPTVAHRPYPVNRPPTTGQGQWNGKLHGTITADRDGWLAYVRLEDPPGLSPITTVGRYDTVEAAQVATDEVWASR